MASSQVQVASSSPFGCVLRDRNRRDRCSPKGANSFQKNLKGLVHSCIPRQPRNFDSDSDENRVDLTELWVHKPQYLENRNDENNQWNSGNNNNKASENWRKVKDVVFPKSESSLELPHSGGVSSLVRKWSDIEAEKKTNSSAFFAETVSCVEEAPACEESSTNEDSSSLGGWESDRTTVKSGPPSVRGGTDSDATESERIRVADIIRKLSSTTGEENHDHIINGGNEAAFLPRIRTSSDHPPAEQLRSPRIIRGRQAFNCFLAQVERERARELQGLLERKNVSKFQHKGRIQAALRLKLLRRGTKARDEPPSSSTTPESNRKPKSSILHLRERFNAGVQHGIADSKAMPRKVADSNAEAVKVSASVGFIDENHGDPQRELSKNRQEKLEHHCRLDDLVERISPHRDVAAPDPLSSRNEEALITQNSGSSFTSDQLEVYRNCQEVVGSSNKSMEVAETESPISNNEVTWKVEQREQQIAGASDEFSIDWEEAWEDDQQSGYPQESEFDQDWIYDVSRPRSEWENLRKTRYQEMLDPFLENNDIRELLQRRSVSNFLSGSMRDIIDQMIMSRSQRQPIPLNSNMQEEVREKVLAEDKSEEADGIVQGGEDGEEYKEEDKYDDGSGNEYSQIQEQADDDQDRNISIESDQMASTSLPQSQSTNFCSERPYAPSSTRHPSIELELIYELKGHMEKLHQEMSEIRSSIKSCMNMQVKLQKSIKQEVAAALSQSGQKSRRGSGSKHPSNGNCCICSEMKIDSLLYRCGHMCTCFKCAHELVWGSGKCPICQAPILDVVRAVYAP